MGIAEGVVVKALGVRHSAVAATATVAKPSSGLAVSVRSDMGGWGEKTPSRCDDCADAAENCN